MKQILFIAVTESLKDTLSQHLSKHSIQAVFCEWDELSVSNNSITYNSDKLSLFACVVLGSRYAKEITGSPKRVDISEIYLLLQRFLTQHAIPYFSFSTNNLVSTKISQLALGYDITTSFIPSHIEVGHISIIKYIESIQLPCILKHPDMDRGAGVALINTTKEAKQFLNKFLSQQTWIIQKYIPNDGDFRMFVVAGKVLGTMKRTQPNSTEFRNNISQGGLATIAHLPVQISNDCMRISQVLDCDVLGVDVIQDIKSGEYFIMEINTNPQYKGFASITKIDVAESIAMSLLKRLNIGAIS